MPRLYADEAPAPEAPIARIARGRDSETILVVEDDDDVRAYTSATLRELGYDVLEAANGRSGLALIEQRPEIRLLFTDVGLPGGMNGRQLAEAAAVRRRNLAVLFTTGYARNAIVHDGRLDPGVQLITKPFAHAALAERIREMLDAQSAPARILVVEDEALIQMLAVENLEELGFQAEVAGSAAEARDKLNTLGGKLAAVIVDIGLPDAVGDVLVGELRRSWPELPILVASGQSEGDLVERFKGPCARPHPGEAVHVATAGDRAAGDRGARVRGAENLSSPRKRGSSAPRRAVAKWGTRRALTRQANR